MKLRAAVIGLGVGEEHIAGYRAHPACEVVAVSDISQEKLAMARERYPELRRTAYPEDLLDDPAIDVVSIASWDDAHHDQIARALERGKHVFAEKPICLRERELVHIRTLLAQNPRLRLSCNHVLRMCPRFRWLRERIAAGELGRLYYAEADYAYGRLSKIVDGWRGRLDDYSVVLGGGVHMVDLLLWLSGDRVLEVSAYGNRIATAGTGFRYNDCVVALLRFESGMIAKVAANFACVHPHFHVVNVYGTAATFLNRREEGLFYASRDPAASPRAVTEAYPGVRKGALIHGFVDWILEGRSPAVLPEDIYRAMNVCFAIDRAAAGSGPVPVEWA